MRRVRYLILLFTTCILPVINTEVRVVHLDHHQSAAFSVVKREAIMTIWALVLLYNQQHSWTLWGHQLTEAAHG